MTMKNTLVNALAFTAGAAIGSLVTWKLVKSKYEKIAQEDIESVKEVFSRRLEESLGIVEKFNEIPNINPVSNEDIRKAIEKPDLMEYAKQLADLGYTDYSDISNETPNNENEEKGGGAPMTDGPYVISPEDFGQMDDYECVSLMYFADGVLSDDWYNVIEDPDLVVGVGSLNTFGEYEDDCVHVRNDDRMTDYEIIRDIRNFSEVKDRPPHLMNGDDE